MHRWMIWMFAGMVAAASFAPAVDAQGIRGVEFVAQRLAPILGMSVGEHRNRPHPFVVEVEEKSEAQIKGLRPGDELIRLNDRPIQSLQRLTEDIKRLRPGQQAQIWVRRGALNLRVDLTVKRIPKAEPVENDEDDEDEEDRPRRSEEQPKDEGKNKKKDRKPPVQVKPLPPRERDE
jgi:C-terminal processing protease CtpA/Prc